MIQSAACKLLTNATEALGQVLSRGHCYTASLGTIRRPVYARTYPVKLIKQDGSSINIMYHTPVGVIKLPYDLNLLDEVERKRRMLRRQMSTKQVKKESNILIKQVTFDPRKYLNKKP